jgi:predicted  nucleic acid-binding Zn-ribbon protein
VPEKTQTTNDHNDDNNNTVTLKVPDDQITTLENCFLGAIIKLENVTLIDSSKILDAVNACNSSIAQIIPQQGTNKSAEAICATLKQQIINLKEERDSLKAQLQHERGNILLVKSQYEDTLKHQREMLNETRNELKNLVTFTNSETAFVFNRLGEKTTKYSSF